jgi:uncharacterized protein
MFPLGGALLPHQALPLHVFEPRYRRLMRDVTAGDGRLGVVLIRRGHEVGGGDERFAVATRARVVHADELDDGRWLVVVLGEQRVRVQRWLEESPYPRATTVELAERHDPERVAAAHRRLKPRLLRVLELERELGDREPPDPPRLPEETDLACWWAPALSPLTALDRQALLEVDDCAERLALLDDLLVGAEEVLTFHLLAEE